MESHALHGDGIYYESGDRLWVNLYAPSTARWDAAGVQLDVATSFPEGESATVKVTVKAPRAFTLSLRRPSWAGNGFAVAVNGTPVKNVPAAGSYVDIKRSWKNGDVVSLALPKSLRLDALPDQKQVAAIMWGPLVLAGDLGPAPERGEDPTPRRPESVRPAVPLLVAAGRPVADWLKPVDAQPGTFRSSGVGKDSDVDFVPFYRLHRRAYAAYWDVVSPAEYDAKKAELAAERERLRRLDAATVASVPIGEAESERTFNPQGEETSIVRADGRAGRRAAKWFSFELPVDGAKPAALVVTYNSDTRQRRSFEILADGQRVGQQTIERGSVSRFFDVEYALEPQLVQGKNKVVVRFQAADGSEIAPVFGIRVVRADGMR